MTTLAVAAVSARLLAEAAALDGHEVVALDLFGDVDTRRASPRWRPIGAPGALRIDPARVLDALRHTAQQQGDEVVGWVPGSGFEGQPDLLEASAELLPLIGTPAAAVRRVRDPVAFFAALAAHGIAHPAVRFEAPADPEGWLLKDARGCGGWHIRHAVDARGAAGDSTALYFQRVMAGAPMSATFIANGERAMLLGINELIVRPVGGRPHVYAGCIGPVAVSDGLAQRVVEAVRALSAAFGLRGWCSLDFIRDGDGDGDKIGVLELNPRPPASLGLYAQRGLIDAQLRACLHGEMPRAGAFAQRGIAGNEIVFARRALTLGPIGAQHLAGRADAHDLPAAGTRFEAGDPICSLSAVGDSAAQVRALLGTAREALTRQLETTT